MAIASFVPGREYIKVEILRSPASSSRLLGARQFKCFAILESPIGNALLGVEEFYNLEFIAMFIPNSDSFPSLYLRQLDDHGAINA
jgi:hypothetical protein